MRGIFRLAAQEPGLVADTGANNNAKYNKSGFCAISTGTSSCYINSNSARSTGRNPLWVADTRKNQQFVHQLNHLFSVVANRLEQPLTFGVELVLVAIAQQA
jgi:hypothetical protein